MRNGLGALNRNLWWAVLTASVLSLAGACGDDDDGSSEEDDEPDGEECLNPGQTMTGCTCASDRPPGSRQCTRDGIWSACTCPPRREDNECDFEGQTIECWICPGEEEGRITECLEDGTFDCSCRDGGMPSDAGRGDDAG